MENSLAYKWVVILFFSVVGIIFTVSVVYLLMGNVAPDTYWGRKMTMPKTQETVSSRAADKFTLELDQGQPIGDRIFFYRGRQHDQIALHVIIPEIDRQYAYPYTINIADAQDGVVVAGIRLRLMTVRPHFVSIKVIN